MKIEKVKEKEVLSDIMNDIYDKDDKKKDINIGFEVFAYALKNDNNEIVGGIHGWKAFSEIYVDELCISEEYRGLGYGKKLLKIVETELNINNDCDNINLYTNDYQGAVNFYKKCGFEIEFIRNNRKNPRFNKIYMVKKF